jgi:hypothetical protein
VMSYTEVRTGIAEQIVFPRRFEQEPASARVAYIEKHYGVVFSDIEYKDDGSIDWCCSERAEDGRLVVYLNNDTFWLLNDTKSSDMYCCQAYSMADLSVNQYAYTLVFYNGGAHYTEVLEEALREAGAFE